MDPFNLKTFVLIQFWELLLHYSLDNFSYVPHIHFFGTPRSLTSRPFIDLLKLNISFFLLLLWPLSLAVKCWIATFFVLLHQLIPSTPSISHILVFYCCCNKLPEHSGLKQRKFINLQIWKSEVQHMSHKSKIKMSVGFPSFLQAVEVDLFPCFFWLLEAVCTCWPIIPFLHFQSQ